MTAVVKCASYNRLVIRKKRPSPPYFKSSHVAKPPEGTNRETIDVMNQIISFLRHLPCIDPSDRYLTYSHD